MVELKKLKEKYKTHPDLVRNCKTRKPRQIRRLVSLINKISDSCNEFLLSEFFKDELHTTEFLRIKDVLRGEISEKYHGGAPKKHDKTVTETFDLMHQLCEKQ